MKEHLPTIIIVSVVLAWSEFRYQQLFSRLENIEHQNDIYKEKAPSRNSKKEALKKTNYSFQDERVPQKTKVKPGTKKKIIKSKIEGGPADKVEESKSLDLDNPYVQEELHQFLEEREKEQKEIKRAEGVGKYLDYVDRRIEAYSQEHQLSYSVSQAVMLEIQARTNEYVAVEHAAEDGEMDWSEAKPEMERIKEEGKINLTEILGGEEEYQEFEGFVWGKK